MALSKGDDKLSICIKVHAYGTSDEIIKRIKKITKKTIWKVYCYRLI